MMESKVIKILKACNRIKKFTDFNLTENEQDTVISLAVNILRERYKPGQLLTDPESVTEYLQLKYARIEYEVFSGVLLDNKNRIISFEELSRGTIDRAEVYCREVVKTVLKKNAAAIIFSHNHPAGDPQPGESDKRITQRLINALSLIDVRVLDHIVVGKEGSVSFAEKGFL